MLIVLRETFHELCPGNSRGGEAAGIYWCIINCIFGGVCFYNNTSIIRPPPRADPQALAFCLPWMANFRGWGLLSCQTPRGGDEKRGQMPRPPLTLQHFSLIARSNSAVLSILMSDFLFQLTSSFVIALGF